MQNFIQNVEKIVFKALPYKKNILITNRISILNFTILIFLKIFYDKIFFLEIDKYLKNKKFLLIFETLGIYWINYNQYNLAAVHTKKLKKSTLFCDKYSIKISRKIWINLLSTFFINKNLLAACINSKIRRNVSSIFEIMEIASILQKKNKVTLFISNNFFFKIINKKYFFTNINCINLDIFKIFCTLFNSFLSIFINTLKNFFIKFSLKKKKYSKYNFKTENKKISVALFPHKGMFAPSGFKDLFYSKKINSNFNKKNIAHIEWNYSDLNEKSNDYYIKNKIPLFIWEAFSAKNKSLITIFKFFIFRFKLIFNFLEFSILLEILESAYQITNAKEKIKNNFIKLKYILVGYDLLFPNEMVIACKHLGITTVAVQDRILIPSWSTTMCYDHYFVLGSASKKIIQKRMGKTIKNINETSLLRNNSFLKKNNGFKNKIKCLVIDFHSQDQMLWYENGRILNNWKSNFIFYNKIVSLSKEYPNILFFIKSKNYLWLKNDYFKNLIKILNKQSNIKILQNQKKWTPAYSIKFTDFAIARYSSLSDQMFYLNKPILIFNYDKYPGPIFNFGNEILIDNLDQLKNKISLITKKYSKYNNSLQRLRKKLFYYHGKTDPIKDLLITFDNKLDK